MKQFPRVEFSIAALLAGLFSLVLGCGVGGISGSGSTKPPPDPDPDPVPLLGACEKMCQNLGGCSPAWASADACKAECQDMEGLLRPTVVNAFTQCGQRATCATFTVKVCLREGAATVGVEVTDRMVNGLCAKAQNCLGTAFNPADCDKYRTDVNVQAVLNESKIYTDSVELCFSGCINNQTCTTLMDKNLLADASAKCSRDCGSRTEWLTVDIPPQQPAAP